MRRVGIIGAMAGISLASVGAPLQMARRRDAGRALIPPPKKTPCTRLHRGASNAAILAAHRTKMADKAARRAA